MIFVMLWLPTRKSAQHDEDRGAGQRVQRWITSHELDPR